jgi:putative sterol carrier protein
MSVEEIIKEIRKKTAQFDASSYHGFLAVQVTLTDIDKVFYVEIKEGRLAVEPYEYNDRQANLVISADKFVKLINKKLNPVMAFTTGQLKVEGDAGRALELANLLS